MKQWLAMTLVGCFLALGCQRQCFLSERDFKDAHLVPRALEEDKTFGNETITGPMPAPPDVTNPDRKPRFMTLQEAIAISLENGTISSRTGIGQGTLDDTPATFQGASIVNQVDTVRVLALAPAIAQSNIEASLARFDAQWVTGMTWSYTDQLSQGLTSFQNGERANFNTSVVKPLASGGLVHTSLDVTYQFLNQPPAGQFGVLNPSYTARLVFGIEQPLLQNSGWINQLLARNPNIIGSTLPGTAAQAVNNRFANLQQGTSFVNTGTIDGILITRLRFDLSRAEFERQMANLVLNVEVAYWKLYQAYGELYTFEEVLRIVHKSWMNNQQKFIAGTLPPGAFYPIRGQYEEFRGERLRALGAVLEAERNLRGLMGLAIEDGERLVPITAPTLSLYRPDWDVCIHDALNLRPELVIARESLRVSQFNLDIQKNFLKPDLRLVAQYVPTGFGTRLDGNGTFTDANGDVRPTNALRSLAGTDFEDWTVGLSMNVPIGYRAEHASIRAGRLALAQSFFALKDQEERIKRYLGQQYQKLTEWYKRIEAARAERRAYAETVRVRYEEFTAGKTNFSDFLLEAQRRLALAQQKEYQAIAEYNSTLARLEFAKGTVLTHSNIVIAEGGLPYCAEVRAVEHERQRSKALLLREPAPESEPGRLVGDPHLPETLDIPSGAGSKDDIWTGPTPKVGKEPKIGGGEPGTVDLPRYELKKEPAALPDPALPGGAGKEGDTLKPMLIEPKKEEPLGPPTSKFIPETPKSLDLPGLPALPEPKKVDMPLETPAPGAKFVPAPIKDGESFTLPGPLAPTAPKEEKGTITLPASPPVALPPESLPPMTAPSADPSSTPFTLPSLPPTMPAAPPELPPSATPAAPPLPLPPAANPAPLPPPATMPLPEAPALPPTPSGLPPLPE